MDNGRPGWILGRPLARGGQPRNPVNSRQNGKLPGGMKRAIGGIAVRNQESAKMPSRLRTTSIALFAAMMSLGAFGCTATGQDDPDSQELTEDEGAKGEGVTGGLAVGAELKATGNVNLRASASTSADVLHVVPSGATVTVESATPSNGFYKVKHGGTVGWSSGKYYEPTGNNAPADGLAAGSALTATADVNLRSGPATSYDVIALVPTGSDVKVVDGTPDNGFYKIDFKGQVGWSSGKYYSPSSGGGADPGGDPGGDPGNGSATDAALARAKSGVGFSYWWGHGRFRTEGPSSSNAGSCSGSCPNCSHGGSYGGDCSGLVAKVWQVPSSNSDLTKDDHPYATSSFVNDTSQWKTVSRGSVKAADAMVYNTGTHGHIFIYSKGDGWGSMYAYECRGCSAGCIGGYRTASSAYHAIRRTGY
jgi:uncharacterized protein YgiM (DUF1202 family)